MITLCSKLSYILRKELDCNTIMLSGGLDSSILSIIGKGMLKNAITIAYKDAPDLEYAKFIAKECNMKHIISNIDDNKVLTYAREIIRIMHTFSPIEIRNSIVIYASLLEAKKNSIDCIITGDGADELFAGYNYLLHFDYEQLSKELERLLKIMSFSSIPISNDLHVRISQPYLSNEIIELAKSIPIELKVREYNGVRFGKWILRECFKEFREIAFRKKMAMEEGSGLSNISYLFDAIIDDLTYNMESKSIYENERVKIRSKEHLYYYKIFRELFGTPKYNNKGFLCPDCLSSIERDFRFCKVCGAFPIKPIYIC
ncbi:MAG: asparagine synthase-related protein [Candidatus Nitrosocaldaceae archaeon]